jgi:hypothetical protein
MRLTPRRIAALPALALASGLFAGCGRAPVATAPPAEGPVELAEVTYKGLDAAVKEQKGKVVLIDVWFLA